MSERFALSTMRRRSSTWLSKAMMPSPEKSVCRQYRLAAANRAPDVQIGPYYQQTPDGDSHVGFRADIVTSRYRSAKLRYSSGFGRGNNCQDWNAEIELVSCWLPGENAIREKLKMR